MKEFKEAEAFEDKAQGLMRLEQEEHVLLLVCFAGGFLKKILDYLNEHRMTYSDDARWLEYLIF